MASAVIYARYSSSGQREESIEDQVRVCTQEAERNGDAVVRVYADKATSGTSTEHRAAFAEMIADSARGSWSAVYVYKTDRFARNRYDSAIYKTKLKRNGVRVVSATERIEDGPDGILLEAVLEGMAEYYSANLGQNVRRGMHGNALKCRHNGVTVYGYDLGEDGCYHVNEEQARVVRTLFSMYDAGEGYPDIIETLSPWRTLTGRPFTMQTLGKMLRNEKYKGVYKYGDVRVEGGMPAIVDEGTFERVQERLALRTRKRRSVVDYLLSGKLFDTDGNRYQSSAGYGKSGRKYTYYRCRKTGHNVPQWKLEQEVAERVREFLDSDGVASAVADLVLEEQEEALADDLAAMDALRARLGDNEREQARMVELAAKTGASDAIAMKLDGLVEERAAVERELAELEKGTPVFERGHVEFWVHEIVGRKDPLEVIHLFVKRVVIDRQGGEMHVEFIFRNGPGGPGGDGPGVPCALDSGGGRVRRSQPCARQREKPKASLPGMGEAPFGFWGPVDRTASSAHWFYACGSGISKGSRLLPGGLYTGVRTGGENRCALGGYLARGSATGAHSRVSCPTCAPLRPGVHPGPGLREVWALQESIS